jgi:hypothetical protein
MNEDYYKAINNYERIARQSIHNQLMKWSVKDYFLKAGICHLATKVCPSNHQLRQPTHFILGSGRIQPCPRIVP